MRTLPTTVPVSEPLLRVLDAACAVVDAARGTLAETAAAIASLSAAIDAAQVES